MRNQSKGTASKVFTIQYIKLLRSLVKSSYVLDVEYSIETGRNFLFWHTKGSVKQSKLQVNCILEDLVILGFNEARFNKY